MTNHPGDLNKETLKKRLAFETYLSLGPGRSIAETAKITGMYKRNVYDLAKRFKWRERAKEWDESNGKGGIPMHIETSLEVGADNAPTKFPVSEDTELDKAYVRKMIDHYQRIIERSLADIDECGKKITSFEQLSKLTKEFRELVDLYHKLTVPAGVGKVRDRGKVAENLTLIMSEMSQEERIAILKGGGDGKMQSVPGGFGRVERGDADADYSEIPDTEGENGRGCDGISGGIEGAEGGDEGKL